MNVIKLAMGLLVGCVFSTGLVNAQQVVIGQQAPQSQQVSINQINHAAWNQLLGTFVNDRGGVNYGAWKSSPAATQALDAYLATLSRANPQLGSNRANQLAFWINAYNAMTVKGILREYPTSSIRNHTSETGGYNIWKTMYLPVGNLHYNLDSIEHKILRNMNEPRIHFAIVCASRSCPPLHVRAYQPEVIDQQLTFNTQKFFANPENFRWDPASRVFYMSSIVEWFGSDFGATQQDQLRYLARYLPQHAQAAAQQGAGSISSLNYSWDLNDSTGSLVTQQQGSGTVTQGSGSTVIPQQGSGTVVQQGFPQQGSGTVVQQGFPQQGSGTVVQQGFPQQGGGTVVQQGFPQQGSGTVTVPQQGSGLR